MVRGYILRVATDTTEQHIERMHSRSYAIYLTLEMAIACNTHDDTIIAVALDASGDIYQCAHCVAA